MDVQLDPSSGVGRDDRTGVLVRDQQVQGKVTAGDRPDRRGAPGVEAGVVAELAAQGGFPGDRVVEVASVGGVEVSIDVDIAMGVDLVETDVAVPPVVRCLAFGLGAFGVEPQDRLGDEPFELGPSDAADGGVEVAVDEPCCLRGEGPGEVGDPLGTPRSHAPVEDGGVQEGEAPGALDDLTDIGPATVG